MRTGSGTVTRSSFDRMCFGDSRAPAMLELASPDDAQHFERTPMRRLHMDDDGQLFEVRALVDPFCPGMQLANQDGEPLGTVVSVDIERGVLTMRKGPEKP